ncbi:MAG: hypothetical protein ABIK89_04370, partial [Planctomycetota bacterium]
PNAPACSRAHEIGSGQGAGYLCGRDVARFLSLVDHSRRIASCLHADTLDELTGILCSPPLTATRQSFGRVGLVLFMHVGGSAGRTRRRVATFYEADGRGGHELLFEWRAETDTFSQAGPLRDPNGLVAYVDFIQQLVDAGEVDARAVRRRVVEHWRRT